MADKHIIRGRSIDGTVYRVDEGWTDRRSEAHWWTFDDAARELEKIRQLNRRRELDDQVGHLTILPR